MTRNRWPLILFAAFLSLAIPCPGSAQKARAKKPAAPKPLSAPALSPEARAAKAFDEARTQGPLTLRAFLYRMPK